MSASNPLLIVSNSAAFSSIMAEHARSSGFTPGVIYVGERDEPDTAETLARITPGSFISVRSAMISCSTVMGSCGSAVFYWEPGRDSFPSLVGAGYDDLERFSGSETLTPLYVIKELIAFLSDTSRLILVVPMVSDGNSGPCRIAGFEWFKAFADDAIKKSTDARTVSGVMDASGNPDAGAEFLCRLASDTTKKASGRWLKFSGKLGLFNTL